MKTYMAKKGEVDRKWYLIDAEGKILGRVATKIAQLLMGKGKPKYSPHVDTGDFVIVINADKVKVSGNKETDKFYYHHTLYIGGIKKIAFRDLLKKNPYAIFRHSIWGMLPKNRLSKRMINKLKVYRGEKHPHEAQKPEKIEL